MRTGSECEARAKGNLRFAKSQLSRENLGTFQHRDTSGESR